MLSISVLPRSLKYYGLDDVIDKIDCICSLLDNVEVGFTDRSFGWTSPTDNRLIEILQQQYEEKCHLTPKITSIHAGLECGYFAKANPELQMISLGPTVISPHSPDECVSIKHTQEVYEILKDTLAQL